MARQRVFLLSVTLTVMAAMPALGQEAAPVSGPARAQSTASTPDFFGVWNPTVYLVEEDFGRNGRVAARKFHQALPTNNRNSGISPP